MLYYIISYIISYHITFHYITLHRDCIVIYKLPLMLSSCILVILGFWTDRRRASSRFVVEQIHNKSK